MIGAEHVSVAAGACHSLAFTSGALYAWGLVSDGRLERRRTRARADAVALEGVVDASAASTLVVVASRGSFCVWGQPYGQLGLGRTDDAGNQPASPCRRVPWASLRCVAFVYWRPVTFGFGPDAQGSSAASTTRATATRRTRTARRRRRRRQRTRGRLTPGLCGKGVVAVAAGGAAGSDAGHTVAGRRGRVLCLGAGAGPAPGGRGFVVDASAGTRAEDGLELTHVLSTYQ